MSKQLDIMYEGAFCYPIHLEQSFDRFIEHYRSLEGANHKKVCIVTDSDVANLYLNEMIKICKNQFFDVISFIFPSGEASKNLDTVEKLYLQLINNRFDRKDLLIALGGGVVGDLTGFAAATFLRGIDFIQVPTTLLSQVDSSIGGKTGVDFSRFKNMVGAFYMPKMVYMNTAVLHSLPQVQFQSGMGEVIKYGLIKDAAYYQWLKDHKESILALDDATLEEMIYVSCKTKKAVVEEDPKEHGIRAHLNFGHTIGHAVEKLSDFSLYHGQCVAIGMGAAAYLSSVNHGMVSGVYEDILRTIESFGLPTKVAGYDAKAILEATKSDKKMDGGQINFVVLDSVGEAVIDKSYNDEMLLDAIGTILE